MRLVLALLFLLPASALAVQNSEKPSGVIANQHVVVNVLSAMYYCKNQRWPADLDDLAAFAEQQKIPLPVKPDWALLKSTTFTYEAGNVMTLVSSEDAARAALEWHLTIRPSRRRFAARVNSGV